MTDSIKVRIEQSGPVGPSRFNYRDTKDRLRSNFTREIKKNQVGRDSLFVMLREFRRNRKEKRGFFHCIGHAVHVYVDARRLPGTVCVGSGFFEVAGGAIGQEDHADRSRAFTAGVRSVIFF